MTAIDTFYAAIVSGEIPVALPMESHGLSGLSACGASVESVREMAFHKEPLERARLALLACQAAHEETERQVREGDC